MDKKCTVYCLNEECDFYANGTTIFGTCSHPFHQSLVSCNDRKQLLLEVCPWKNPPQRPGYIQIERYLTALPGYIIPAKRATGPSLYKMVHQMLSVKRYRPIHRAAEILQMDSPWPDISIEEPEEV